MFDRGAEGELPFSPSLLSLEIFLAAENEIRRNRQLIYAGRKLVGLPRTLIENEELSTNREDYYGFRVEEEKLIEINVVWSKV